MHPLQNDKLRESGVIGAGHRSPLDKTELKDARRACTMEIMAKPSEHCSRAKGTIGDPNASLRPIQYS